MLFHLLCVTALLTKATSYIFTDHVGWSDDSAADDICWHRESHSTSICPAGVVHEGRGFEELDDASFLQMGLTLSGDGPENLQAESLAQWSSSEHPPLSSILGKNNSALVNKEQSVEFQQEIGRLTQTMALATDSAIGQKVQIFLMLAFFCTILLLLCVLRAFTTGILRTFQMSSQRKDPPGLPAAAGLPTEKSTFSWGEDSPESTRPPEVSAQGSPGMPLCPSLIIPDGTRLVCFIPNRLKKTKQTMASEVKSFSESGRVPLFRLHVAELEEPPPPSIMLKTLDGVEQLAHLSTEELWIADAEAVALEFPIYRPKGAIYGTLQKTPNGEFRVVRGDSCLMTITGDYANHNIQVTGASGRTIASTIQSSPEEYEVTVQSRTDAGLVVLALLAVDKCIQ